MDRGLLLLSLARCPSGEPPGSVSSASFRTGAREGVEVVTKLGTLPSSHGLRVQARLKPEPLAGSDLLRQICEVLRAVTWPAHTLRLDHELAWVEHVAALVHERERLHRRGSFSRVCEPLNSEPQAC